jgi:hypothetical protein
MNCSIVLLVCVYWDRWGGLGRELGNLMAESYAWMLTRNHILTLTGWPVTYSKVLLTCSSWSPRRPKLSPFLLLTQGRCWWHVAQSLRFNDTLTTPIAADPNKSLRSLDFLSLPTLPVRVHFCFALHQYTCPALYQHSSSPSLHSAAHCFSVSP